MEVVETGGGVVRGLGPVVETESCWLPWSRLVLDLRLTLWTLHWLSPLIKVDSEPESSTATAPIMDPKYFLCSKDFLRLGDFYRIFLHFQIDEFLLMPGANG